MREIAVTDLAVHPQTRNAYLSVMRGQGTNATAALLRVDGAGKIDVRRARQGQVLEGRPAERAGRRPPMPRRGNPRTSSVTDMAFVDGRLYVAGLSNEEFSSKLRSVPYPFTSG